MAKHYFEYVPNFEYVSRLKNAQNISDYTTVKNLFKRAKIRPDIWTDLSKFTKYKIVGDERPDNVAFKQWKDQKLDWLVMMCNNIINLQDEWPLEERAFYQFLISKYTSEAGMEKVHHYETKKVADSKGRLIVPKGLKVPIPTCNVIFACITPFSFNLSNSSSLKCKPAVGAAIAPG